MIGQVGQRPRNDEASSAEPVAPEVPQGLVHYGAPIRPVHLAEQTPAFGRSTTVAIDDQLELDTAPLPRRQTAHVGTTVDEAGIGAEPVRQRSRQRLDQLHWMAEECEARQGRVRGKLGCFEESARAQRWHCHAVRARSFIRACARWISCWVRDAQPSSNRRTRRAVILTNSTTSYSRARPQRPGRGPPPRPPGNLSSARSAPGCP